MSILKQDLIFALRGIVRRPGFAAVILLTLALGIGANSAIFTVVNGALLRPLPFPDADRLVHFAHGSPYQTVSEPEFVDYSRGVKSLAKLAAYSGTSVLLSHDAADPVRAQGTRVSRDFFDILRVAPLLGRTFSADEFSPSSKVRATVISHRFWVQDLGADPGIVGKVIRIGDVPVTVIGVMPPTFTFPSTNVALWTAWRMNPDSLWTRNNHYLQLVGRLADGASVEQTRAQVATLDARWLRDFPETYSPDVPLVASILPMRDYLFGPTRPYLLALLGAVGFILLIACVNVANLLLVRGESRRKELAIRTALGASSGRMMRQLLTESMVFAVLGALLGIAVAWSGTRGLLALAPSDLPRADQIGVDASVVGFTVAVTIVTGLLFGAIPALRMMRSDSAGTLREGGKTSMLAASRAARRSLAVAEIALAVIMMSGAGLLVRSLLNLQAIDLGFEPDGLLTMQLTMPASRYSDTAADERVRQILARVARLPGTEASGAVSFLPISGADPGWSIMINGQVLTRISDSPAARPEHVTPDYFRAMRIRIVRGRGFTEQDRMGAPPVAVISEGMAKQLWPGVDPIGHTLKMFGAEMQWATIVGVVADVRARGFQDDVPPTMYFPYSQSGQTAYGLPRSMTLVVRATGDLSTLANAVRGIVRQADPAIPISDVATMDRVVGNSIASRRFATILLAGFAVLALVLAGVGIYGVISYGVSQRRSEIGIRLAMGASPRAIVRLVVGEGGRMTIAGLGIGLLGAFVVERLIRTMLVGVGRGDLPTLIGVIIVLTLVAVGACLVPARRAMTVSPTEALRDA